MAGTLVHFELLAEDPTRARGFWTGLFGWDFGNADISGIEYSMTRTGEGQGGAIYRVDDDKRGPVVYFDTDDIDVSLEQVGALGGRAGEKQPIPHIGFFAHCTDTEGNDFGLFQAGDSVGA
jgi:predicted enzyme related to lactoylglutathione lyase